MGHGIAQVLATQPGDVWLYDISRSALDRALVLVRDGLAMLERHGLIDEAGSATLMGRIRTTTDLGSAVESASFVIEATPEDLELKQHLFAELDRVAPDDSILATNTSAYTISQISVRASHRDRIIGSHFFQPAQLMPLVEVSRGPSTGDDIVDRTVVLWEACGKVPIRIEEELPGYLANRMQAALVREAVSLLDRGVATADDIDTAARLGFGLRLLVSGPLAQRDIAGLDLHVAIARELWPDLDQSTGPHALALDKVDRGDLGLKTGRGFHDWSGNDAGEVHRARNESLLTTLIQLGLGPKVDVSPDDVESQGG